MIDWQVLWKCSQSQYDHVRFGDLQAGTFRSSALLFARPFPSAARFEADEDVCLGCLK